jgi:hypothetical protein
MFSLMALAGLMGCDAHNIQALEEGVSSENDVRARFGQPEKEWEGTNGVRILEFNRQPEGSTNYMISIGIDGKMVALRQVLTPENFARIRPGMMMEDVRKSLGKPAKVSTFALKPGETHYDWRWNEPPNRAKVFSVVFDSDLRVVSSGSVDDLRAEMSR